MFNSDKPITLRSDDLLERDSFCKHFAKSILRYQDIDTLIIGLLGKWGSGKTSIVNLTLEHIDTEYIDNPQIKPIIIKFNPWNFSDQKNLLSQFFILLSKTLKRKEFGKTLNQVGDLVEDYIIFLEPVTITLTGVPGITIIAKSLFKSIKDFFVRKLSDLEHIKKKIVDKLLHVEKKIIIIIDDVDRLTNEEVRQIFQLVKSLADFPNVIYILSFDKEIVCDALKEVQKGDGSEFIEKIIQVPIEVPLAQKSEIYNLLFVELNKVMKEIPEDSFDNYYWGNIFNFGINKCFETIRDVRRFMNVLNFGFASVKEEINPVDFLAVTAIQVFIPELYNQIKSNKGLFVSESIKFLDTAAVKGIADEKTDYEKILTFIPEDSRNDFHELLKKMFPKIELLENENSFSYTDENMNKWLLDKRICHPDKFDVFFRLSLGKNEIPEKMISHLFDVIDDKKTFDKEIDQLIKSGSISYLLSSIYARLEKINPKKQSSILKFLLDKGDLFMRDQHITSVLFTKIVNRYDDKDKLFKDVGEYISCSENGLFTYVSLVDFMGLQHSSDSSVAEKGRMLNLDKIKELESIVIKKIEESTTKEDFLLHEKLPYILYRWKRFGGEEKLNIFLDGVKSDNKLLIKLINAFTYTIKSFNTGDIVPKLIFDIYYDDLIKFIDREETFQKLFGITNNEIYDSLTDREKESIKLFIRNYEGKVGRNFSSN